MIFDFEAYIQQTSDLEMSSPGSASNASPRQPELNHVSVRAPPFLPDDPELWFAQLENQFAITRITNEDTKFSYVVFNLDAKYMREVRDIIMNPPETNKYLHLKTHLIERLNVSQQEKTSQLLEHEEMGDRKPSQFLRHLQDLAGGNVPDNIIRPLWLSRLPTGMKDILTTGIKADLTAAAELADLIHTTTGQHIAETSAASNNFEAMMEQVIARIEAMTMQITAALARRQGSRSRLRQQAVYRDGLCWYHAHFGDDARNCSKPCTYKRK